mgnify:CR=1 FL=1
MQPTYTKYADLNRPELRLYHQLVRDLAGKLLTLLDDDERLRHVVDHLTYYDNCMTVFEEASSILMDVGIAEPVFPESIYADREKNFTNWGRLHTEIEDITSWLEKSDLDNPPFLEEVIGSWLHVFAAYGGLDAGRSWLTLRNGEAVPLKLFSEAGFATEETGKFRWTRKIAFPMCTSRG